MLTGHSQSTQAIGTIAQIWRYPVSSLGGEMCSNAEVGPGGLEGDRRFGLFDPVSGSVAAPEKEARWRPALFLQSAIDADGVRIGFPGGSWFYLGERDLPSALAAHFGFAVAVGSYRQADPLCPSLPVISNRYAAAPLHLLTSASLLQLQRLSPESVIDCRRFRPNILLETGDAPGYSEFQWIGQTISFDGLDMAVTEATKRCGMTLIAQPQLREQPEILRTILRHSNRSLGVYCRPSATGRIAAGCDATKA